MVMVPLWIFLLSAPGFVMVGGAIRQPEINRLKKQVRDLQNENSKLMRDMKKQQEDVETLLIGYSQMKFYQVLNKSRQKQHIREEILLEYQSKEYIDLLVKVVNAGGNEKLSEEQKQYFELCTRLMEGKYIGEENEKAMKGYILKKYKKEIRTMKDLRIADYAKQVV